MKLSPCCWCKKFGGRYSLKIGSGKDAKWINNKALFTELYNKAGTSHTICPACYKAEIDEIDEFRKKEKRDED